MPSQKKKTKNREEFATYSPYCNHQQQVDLVAGNFNGAAWRRQSGSNPSLISSIEEAFVNTNLPLPPGPTPLWDLEVNACGFLKPPDAEDDWQIPNHGAFTITYSTLGL